MLNHAKQGRLYWVKNTDHKTGEADIYGVIRIEDADGGNERFIAFTEFMLKDMEDRARKNSEDMPHVSKIGDFLD